MNYEPLDVETWIKIPLNDGSAKTVRQTEKLKKNREERRPHQAKEKAEQEASLQMASGSPHWELQYMKLCNLEIKDRDDAIKKSEIKINIETSRQQLEAMWCKAYFTEDQKRNFSYFDSDVFTEDVLSSYEVELEKMKNYLDENKEIFELVEMKADLWNKFHELQKLATLLYHAVCLGMVCRCLAMSYASDTSEGSEQVRIKLASAVCRNPERCSETCYPLRQESVCHCFGRDVL